MTEKGVRPVTGKNVEKGRIKEKIAQVIKKEGNSTDTVSRETGGRNL